MFKNLSDKFHNLFGSLMKKGTLTEGSIADAVREVRLALLDSDVNYQVVSALVKNVKEKSLGQAALGSVKAGDQFIKIVHDELVSIMGGALAKPHLKGNPAIILLCGLQGSGKTTQAAKLALLLKGKEYLRKPLLVACDLQRPAAVMQLEILAGKAQVPFFSQNTTSPLEVVKGALAKARALECDTVIVDTAGRLHLDESLMQELSDLKTFLSPSDTIFVASASIGQDAVTTALEFDQKIGITGSILTMLDGSSRAGSVLSIMQATGKPLLFEGVGEGISDLQPFDPRSMADRILGMGDVVNLVRKAESCFEEGQKEDLEAKFLSGTFSYQDYLSQMRAMKKMGSMGSLLKMIPGFSSMDPSSLLGEDPDKKISRMEAIILSMTRKERLGDEDLIPARRRRIAAGSGVQVEEVNRLIKNFKQFREFSRQLPQLQKKMKKGAFGASSPQELLGKMKGNLGRFF